MNGYAGSDVARIVEMTGISHTGSFAVYSSGALPVARVEVLSTAVLEAFVEDAVKESGWFYSLETIQGTPVRVWPLHTFENKRELSLALLIAEGVATLTVFSDQDSDKEKAERLALVLPEASLKSTGEVSTIKSKYDFTDYTVGFVHFERLVKGVFDSENNSFGRGLAKLIPREKWDAMNSEVSAECQVDFVKLANDAPRLVVGYTAVSVKNERLSMSFTTQQEIKNTPVLSELTKMQGHIPAHAQGSSDKLLGFGLGIDADTLTASALALWNQFINTQFSCDYLINAQAVAKETNPAILSRYTGMAQGIKGLGVSVYDVKVDEKTGSLSDLSAILSIATLNPETLASMAQGIPFINGPAIPVDGSSVAISIPMLPPSIELKASIQGQYLVLFSGPNEQVVQSMSQENLDANGLYSVALNYRRLAELDALNVGQQQTGSAQSCVLQQQVKHFMSQMNMDVAVKLAINEHGFETAVDTTLEKSKNTKLNLGGEYAVEYLNDGCKWESTGTDVLDEDGTGRLEESNGECITFQSDYNWIHSVDSLSLTPSSSSSRDSCEEQFIDDKLEPYACQVINVKDNSFQCVFDSGTEHASLYRYTKQ